MSSRSLPRRLTSLLLLSGVSFGSYIYVQSNDDLKRTLKLWKGLGPIISHYRYVEFKHKLFKPNDHEANSEWDRLNDMYADKVTDTLTDLRGFYIKVAQVLAHRGDDLPEIYIEKLRKLEDAVPALLDGKDAREKIKNELGVGSVDEVFSYFGDVPVGSASIGQVHEAVLKKNGQKVAVKIQSPGVEVK